MFLHICVVCTFVRLKFFLRKGGKIEDIFLSCANSIGTWYEMSALKEIKKNVLASKIGYYK